MREKLLSFYFYYLFESFECSNPNEQPQGHEIFVDLGPRGRSQPMLLIVLL